MAYSVPKHAGEGGGVMAFITPICEIGYVTHPPDVTGPAVTMLGRSRIEPNWEEYGGSSISFFLERGLNFLFHPLTPNRVFGNDHKHSIVFADDLIDMRPDRLTNAEILRGIPTLHTHTAKVCPKPSDKFLVPAAVTDKARKVLDLFWRAVNADRIRAAATIGDSLAKRF